MRLLQISVSIVVIDVPARGLMQKKVTGVDPSPEEVRVEFMKQKSEVTTSGSKQVGFSSTVSIIMY